MAYEALNRFDFPLERWLNGHFGKHPAFDGLVGFVSGNELISGALLISLFWWAWYRHSELVARRVDREHVVATLVAGGLAFFLARVLVAALPFRIRPRLEPALHFFLPPSWNAALSTNWNSFPCDTALMGLALAVGLCFICRRVGVLAVLFVLAVSCFPLIYLGLHYPSDVLVGLLLGAVLGYLLNQTAARVRIAGPFLDWEACAPGSFYAVLFLISYEFATQFTSVRTVAGSFAHAISRILGQH
jgi:undecaprenyl-diphosphatase